MTDIFDPVGKNYGQQKYVASPPLDLNKVKKNIYFSHCFFLPKSMYVKNMYLPMTLFRFNKNKMKNYNMPRIEEAEDKKT